MGSRVNSESKKKLSFLKKRCIQVYPQVSHSAPLYIKKHLLIGWDLMFSTGMSSVLLRFLFGGSAVVASRLIARSFGGTAVVVCYILLQHLPSKLFAWKT